MWCLCNCFFLKQPPSNLYFLWLCVCVRQSRGRVTTYTDYITLYWMFHLDFANSAQTTNTIYCAINWVLWPSSTHLSAPFKQFLFSLFSSAVVWTDETNNTVYSCPLWTNVYDVLRRQYIAMLFVCALCTLYVPVSLFLQNPRLARWVIVSHKSNSSVQAIIPPSISCCANIRNSSLKTSLRFSEKHISLGFLIYLLSAWICMHVRMI